MKVYQETAISADGLALNFYRWIPEYAKAAIVISHGLSEHAGRYDQLARWFALQGYEVHALDHRGQGRSAGLRGHVDDWRQYARDLEQLRQTVASDKQYLLGHSMGGMISVLHLLEYPERFDAVGLSGPLTELSVRVPKVQYYLGKLVNKCWPTLRQQNKIDPFTVCSDRQVVEDYMQDPLNHGVVSVRWFSELQQAIERVAMEANRIKTPIGIWHGSGDQLVEPWVSEKFYKRLHTDLKHREEIEGALHEILLEPNWKETAEKIERWFERF